MIFCRKPCSHLILALLCAVAALMPAATIAHLRNETKRMILHGFDGYMQHAFPEDELRPITCIGRSKDSGADNLPINDICGGFAMTLIDSLDTMAIIGDKLRFEQGVRDVIDHVSFDQDSKVQVFEVSIRVLGGLLASHQLALGGSGLAMRINWYQNELLDLAIDLGRRLLPAFQTATGLPLPRINLRFGTSRLQNSDSNETCSAGAGSLILEFAVLSKLSGIPDFEIAAKNAYMALWSRRRELDLVGSGIDAHTGQWQSVFTSVGASVDSFYEYALKGWVLLGDQDYLAVWQTASKAITKHIVDESGFLFCQVHMQTGFPLANHIDSLSAFFPGLLVLAGDLSQAIRMHLTYATLWKRYRAIPERYDYTKSATVAPHYPLRPEFVESTYLLFQATKDPFYLDLGSQILEDLKTTQTDCGFAGISDVSSGSLEDRMESFMLSETLKYLYLLFDPSNPIHDSKREEPWVFSTEAHILSRPDGKAFDGSTSSGLPPMRCEVPQQETFFSAVMSRADLYHAGVMLNIPVGVMDANITELAKPNSLSRPFKRPWAIDLFFGNLAGFLSAVGDSIFSSGKNIVIKSLGGQENPSWSTQADRQGEAQACTAR